MFYLNYTTLDLEKSANVRAAHKVAKTYTNNIKLLAAMPIHPDAAKCGIASLHPPHVSKLRYYLH